MAEEKKEEEFGKQRINLYLKSALIDRAQALNINISKITNEMLEDSLPEEAASKNTNTAYHELFEKIKPILAKYKTSALIGAGGIGGEIFLGKLFLDYHGKYYLQVDSFSSDTVNYHYNKPDGASDWIDAVDNQIMEFDNVFEFLEKNDNFYFYQADYIFSCLLEAIADKKRSDRETVQTIEKIKRIITAIEPDLLKEEEKK